MPYTVYHRTFEVRNFHSSLTNFCFVIQLPGATIIMEPEKAVLPSNTKHAAASGQPAADEQLHPI